MECKNIYNNGFRNVQDYELFWFKWALLMSSLNKNSRNKEYVERKIKEWKSTKKIKQKKS